MNPNDPNVVLLELVAARLGETSLPNAGKAIRLYGRTCGYRLARLMTASAFLEALPGHLPGDPASQERLPDLEEKLQ